MLTVICSIDVSIGFKFIVTIMLETGLLETIFQLWEDFVNCTLVPIFFFFFLGWVISDACSIVIGSLERGL